MFIYERRETQNTTVPFGKSSKRQLMSSDVAQPSAAQLASVDSLNNFIRSLSTLFFDGVASAQLDSTLQSSGALLQTFLSDAKHSTLCIQYVPGVDNASTTTSTATSTPTTATSAAGAGSAATSTSSAGVVTIQLEVTFVDTRANSIILLKRSADGLVLKKDAQQKDVSLSSQLQVVNLPAGSPLESMHATIHNTLSPFFNSFVRVNESNRKDTGSNAGVLVFFFFFVAWFVLILSLVGNRSFA
jgi:hypothetical protein